MMRGGAVTALDGEKGPSFGYNYLEFHETNNWFIIIIWKIQILLYSSLTLIGVV